MLSLKVIIVSYTFLSSINPVSAMNFISNVTLDMAIYIILLFIDVCTFNDLTI